ncbi:beta-propeller domain-containing protein [Actinophytocola sp.]|uniref:beta-propeller domain-containing protein n=1 Tax=Actinophytocola sp. TaxID=1872138 RepID=UPI003D6B290B
MNQDLPRWPRIAVAAAAVVGLGVGVAGTAVVVGMADGDRTEVIDPGAITLVSYDSCDSALRELKAAALPHVGPYGMEGDAVFTDAEAAQEAPAAAPAPGAGMPAKDAEAASSAGERSASGAGEQAEAPGHSGTNNYESDVDEPDIVKTDGRRVVSVVDGQLRVVDVAGYKQTAKVTLPGGHATQLLLAGDRALVLTTSGGTIKPMPRGGIVERPGVGGGSPGSPGEPVPDVPPDASPPIDDPPPSFGSQLALVDLTGAGKVLGTLAVEGTYLDARQVGSVARVVVRSTPHLKFTYPDGDLSPSDLEEKNRAVVESSSISDWLPRYQLAAGDHVTSGELVECTAVSHPKSYTGSGLLTILTLDLTRELGTGDPISIAADGNTVYGTGTNLYVADDHVEHGAGGFGPTDRPRPSGGQRTEVYQFDISKPGRPVHVASGGVEGGLLNQYSLSEHEGNLRIATTITTSEQSHSAVSVLTRRGKELAQVGRIDGLGKGERIYAVRFLGDEAYVVTFRQTDPLYTVDLSVPASPRVTGELKITGYSAYLHPVGQGRLLGVGQEATDEGMTTGTQVSLFDTSDPRGAERIGQVQYAGAHSEVEGDPHAFLYWPDRELVVIPMTTYGNGTSPDAGALVLRVSANTVSEVGMVRHTVDRSGGTPFTPRRALVIGDELWTVSEVGMLVSDIDELTQVAWLPFA